MYMASLLDRGTLAFAGPRGGEVVCGTFFILGDFKVAFYDDGAWHVERLVSFCSGGEGF